ncbi:MAG: sigma-70 family RNA polymerase sigma factor [Sedimentibacter sp.]
MIGSFALFNNMNYNREVYDSFSDIELVEKARNNDECGEICLFMRYMFLVKSIISSFFIVGWSQDDLFQEAMIGLFKSLNSFNVKYGCSFKHYAEICIRRQIISAMRKSNANEATNCIFVCNCNQWENDCISEKEFSKMNKLNPETIILAAEKYNNYYEISTKLLSKFEKNVLDEYCKEKSYEEISLTLKKDSKSIDNALQRVRKKLLCHRKKLVIE